MQGHECYKYNLLFLECSPKVFFLSAKRGVTLCPRADCPNGVWGVARSGQLESTVVVAAATTHAAGRYGSGRGGWHTPKVALV
jgi:hypothetical protein